MRFLSFLCFGILNFGFGYVTWNLVSVIPEFQIAAKLSRELEVNSARQVLGWTSFLFCFVSHRLGVLHVVGGV